MLCAYQWILNMYLHASIAHELQLNIVIITIIIDFSDIFRYNIYVISSNNHNKNHGNNKTWNSCFIITIIIVVIMTRYNINIKIAL